MELGLQKIGNNDITPSGAMYIEKLADTLHRVRKYKVSLYGDRTKEISPSRNGPGSVKIVMKAPSFL